MASKMQKQSSTTVTFISLLEQKILRPEKNLVKTVVIFKLTLYLKTRVLTPIKMEYQILIAHQKALNINNDH